MPQPQPLPPLTKAEILIALDGIWNKATNDQRPAIDALADAVRQRGVGGGEHPISLAAGSMTPPEATEEMVKPETEVEAEPEPEAESEAESSPSPSPPPSAHAATDDEPGPSEDRQGLVSIHPSLTKRGE
jgi:hypothetical protein